MNSFEKDLGDLAAALDELQNPFVERFERFLASIEGQDFGSLERNKMIAKGIQEMASRLRMLFRCPKCDQPGRFRCAKSGNSPHGSFSFYHVKSTHGGTSVIPKLILVRKPDGLDKDE